MNFSLGRKIRKIPAPRYIVTASILLLCIFWRPSLALSQAAISVDAQTVIGTVNPMLFGDNISSPGSAGGIWDVRINDLHAGAAPLVKALTLSVLRYPGGSQSDDYFWEDAIGHRIAATAPQGTSWISLETAPDWDSISSGLFIDATWGQFGDKFTFTGTNGARLEGVSGVSTSHPSGIEVRPGPRQGQPSWFNNLFGTDEHMKLVTSLGANAIITVNYGSGKDRTGALSTMASLSQKVKRAAAWVAYLNGRPEDTRSIGADDEGNDWHTVGYWAQKRVDRGHSAPYNVTHWEIGNEVYGDWETGFTTVGKYANDFIAFVATMKAIDPSIKVGAVAMSYPHKPGYADSQDEWNATLIRTAGAYIDFLVLHLYYPSARSSEISYGSTTWFTAVMAAAQQAMADLREIRVVIAANSSRANQIELVVTEYGILPIDSTDPRDHSNLARALYEADLIMNLFRYGGELGVTIATSWNLHGSNETAAIRYDWSTGARVTRPQYHAAHLIRNYLAPKFLSTSVTTPTFSTTKVGNVNYATSVPAIEVIASTDNAGKLTLLVLNRSEAITTSVQLLGFVPQPTATVRILTADSLATNNEDNTLAVVTNSRDISSATAMFSYTFPAHSLTIIELQSSSTPAPPVAVISANPTSGTAPLTVTFNGSGSTASGDAKIMGYNWNMGDGNTMAGISVSHTFTKLGTYTVTLTVTDSGGLTGTASTTIKVSKARRR
jgi:alpha-L-arabinofuranosidase